ncbi:WD40 repeat-containing protein [Heterostelium album PN500]|uniref:Coatomer subunit beta' n=1 Tax=Heterostelium pallidum (strain ATCC 26659 / Pp 5 / PN500) TaxID=670386 RepID=D3BD99_HETP5|nr:WD40 repeat-containing protein [Heterostelium album PN500]EFA80543.1 WD40 repeat-containing protein [Heterostelium album PN500]|eukprot:XP_020432663.1 WD40 repeat-containing protein [Heterostelium album PN500]
MPLRLDIKKKLSTRSDRVKSVDIHPTEPWILASLYNGNVFIWNYETQNMVKSFEVSPENPVRAAKFIARKQWIVTGSDDTNMRVYNYNTMEKIKTIEAHGDYIRCIVVHPTQPYVLTSSDDMSIKLWDWERNWQNIQIYEGHSHYVMSIAINPKDTNVFATASLDKSIKVWGLHTSQPHFTLEGHEKGVNSVEYFMGGEKPYLISGADDKTVKIWDYQSKTCVQTLEGHSNNVSVVCFHPELPLILSGSEDGTVKLWHSSTYRLEKTLNYGMGHVWAMNFLRGSNFIGLGYDDGTVVLKLGKNRPPISMDSTGKIIWARHNEVQISNLKTTFEQEVQDGEKLNALQVKDLGNCEIFPQKLHHNSNGRFVAVCGDGEFIIYTALAWRNKSFGSALEFVWSGVDSGQYGVRESTSRIKVFKNFKETHNFKPSFTAEGIFGGTLLGVRSNSFVCFYDWDTCDIIRRIEICPKNVFWSEDGETFAITTESSAFILKYNKEAVRKYLESGQPIEEEGIEDAFEVIHEIEERIGTACWVGDCFIYTNRSSKLNYCVGTEVVTISHLDKHMYLLGYIPETGRLYLSDKNLNIVSYKLHIDVINYQTAILREDFDTASKLLPKLPQEQRNSIAHFLESQGHKEMALEVSLDLDHQFELAIQLENLKVAHAIALKSDSEQKYRHLADLALTIGDIELAENCMKKAEDLPGLLLLYTSTGNVKGMNDLAALAEKKGQNNICFLCKLLVPGQLKECLEILSSNGAYAEAALMSRTYMPSEISSSVQRWREALKSISPKIAESLADPAEYPNLFPGYESALEVEKKVLGERERQVESAAELLSQLDLSSPPTNSASSANLIDMSSPIDNNVLPTQTSPTPPPNNSNDIDLLGDLNTTTAAATTTSGNSSPISSSSFEQVSTPPQTSSSPVKTTPQGGRANLSLDLDDEDIPLDSDETPIDNQSSLI